MIQCFSRTVSFEHVRTMSWLENTTVLQRAVVDPPELLAVIELSLSCHWAVIELSLSCHWAALSCMSWGLVAQFLFMKRTFVLARRGKAQSEDISAVRQSFWDDVCFFFLFCSLFDHNPLHVLHHLTHMILLHILDISYIIALSQCPCFVRLFPLHLSQNLLHGQHFIWVLQRFAPDPQTWAFLSKVFGKHCWVRVCPLETSKIFRSETALLLSCWRPAEWHRDRSAPNIFWIPVLHKLHRIAFDSSRSSSPHRCRLGFYRSWVAKLCIPSKSQAKSRLSQT